MGKLAMVQTGSKKRCDKTVGLRFGLTVGLRGEQTYGDLRGGASAEMAGLQGRLRLRQQCRQG
jgi:hypothetical protein